VTTIDFYLSTYEFGRGRTLGLLDTIANLPDAAGALAFRPGPGRAHVGWQLMHIAITEEVFATARIAPHKTGHFQEIWPRFRGGSVPDDDVPSAETIRKTLAASREELVETLREWPEERLDEIPPSLADRGWSVRTALKVLAWHEAHHQGQAHLTLNLYRGTQA